MCNRAIPNNYGMLVSVPDQYKTQKISNKAFHNHYYALEFVPD